MGRLTARQLKTLAIIPKFSAVPSLVGCAYIAVHVLRSKKRRARVYHRLLLSMSIHDFIWAFKSFLSTWPIPSQLNKVIWGASGTQQTCTAAGFVGKAAALTSVFYSGFLTLFFLLVISYGWRESQLKKCMEPLFHVISMCLGWGTAIAGLPLKLYNPHAWSCALVAIPLGCTESYQATVENPANCKRGDNASIYRWAFSWAWLWATFLFLILAMSMMYWSIRKRENASRRYSFSKKMERGESMTSSSTVRQRNRKSRAFMNQALLYCIFFFVTWIFGTLSTTIRTADTSGKTYYPLIVLTVFFNPLQGFFNAIIYLRPRYLSYRRNHPQASICRLIRDFWPSRSEELSSGAAIGQAGSTEEAIGQDNEDTDEIMDDDYME